MVNKVIFPPFCMTPLTPCINFFLGHKNALYQSTLAKKLPYSSFRFDLHGNGDSEGQPGYSHIAVRVFSFPSFSAAF